MNPHTPNSALTRVEEDVLRSRTARRVLGVAIFVTATALGARIAIPIPGTPVPFTLQLVCVLLSGALLGPGLGATAQIAYVTLGAMGAPVFAAGGGVAYLLGPTGGYLLAFPLAAYTVGTLAGSSGRVGRLGRLGRFGRITLGLVAGTLAVHAGGAAWLAVVTGSLEQALRVGVGPFLAFDVVKIGLVLFITLKTRRRALELF